jgi:FkbM family methyltransferase
MSEETEYVTEGLAEYVLTLFDNDFKGVCVDVGAFDPFYISNSWLFEKAGWDTYCVEPNPHCIPRLKQYRKNVLEYACSYENKDDVELFVFNPALVDPKTYGEVWMGEASGTGLIDHRLDPKDGESHKNIFSHSVNVKVRTLDWLMENEIKQDHIDYLTIDVERNEMNVLLGTDLLKWKPKVLVVEHFECDPEQVTYLQARGYRYVHRINFNDIYMLETYYQERLECQ